MKKKVLLVLFFIALILIGVGIFFYFDKSNDAKQTELLEKAYKSYEDNINDLNNYLGYAYPIEDVSGAKLQDILYFAFMNLESDNKNTEFSSEELREIVTKYFGSDFAYQDTNISKPSGELYYNYDATNNKYVRNLASNPYDNFARSRFYILNKEYDKNTDTITIKGQVLYCDYADDYYGPIIRYYSSYKDSAEKKNIIYTDPEPNEDIDKFDLVYEKVKDKLPVVSYVLGKDSNGNYVLKSINIG